MPSPFPGMNPFLETEDAWHDFHERFIPLAADEIGRQVGPNYIVCVMVSRIEERPKAGVWPISLRDTLPTIPIPLREEDAVPLLDLQDLLHRLYDAGRYGFYIYDEPLAATLSPDDQAWVGEILAGIRASVDSAAGSSRRQPAR